VSKFIIQGGTTLSGEIQTAGNKNAALPVIAATVLTDEACTLHNVPQIRDVDTMLALLRDLGKNVDRISPDSYRISGSVQKSRLDNKLAGNLRASILYMAPLLARTGQVETVPPGGCVIGRRNVDTHFDVLSAFGAKYQIEEKNYKASINKTRPANIFLLESSVTATENALLLAALTEGQTIIDNAAAEPHVVDLADVLNKMGSYIQGAGTNHVQIQGARKLSGFEHRIVPDHIETGTFAIAAACNKGDLLIHDAYPEHFYIVGNVLKRMGVHFKFEAEHTLHLKPSKLVSNDLKIRVGLWPGFPTDLMSPLIVLATQAHGVTLCHDWMYESRMFFVDKLIAMGAQITQCDPHRVLVSGPTQLRGQELNSPDIRAGIALMIAALSARGRSIIDRAELIDRGYERITERLNRLGAQIERAE
jgi:UDP-N-acetylglucosamine 1-carboxyvinyltransferase